MLYYSNGSETTELTNEDLKTGLYKALELIGDRKKVLALPPDFSESDAKCIYAGLREIGV